MGRCGTKNLCAPGNAALPPQFPGGGGLGINYAIVVGLLYNIFTFYLMSPVFFNEKEPIELPFD